MASNKPPTGEMESIEGGGDEKSVGRRIHVPARKYSLSLNCYDWK